MERFAIARIACIVIILHVSVLAIVLNADLFRVLNVRSVGGIIVTEIVGLLEVVQVEEQVVAEQETAGIRVVGMEILAE